MHFSFTLYKDTRTSVFSELELFMGKILNNRGFYCCPIFPAFADAQKLKIMQILFPVFPTFFDSRRWELDRRDRRAVIFARTQSFNCFISFSLSFLYWPMVVTILFHYKVHGGTTYEDIEQKVRQAEDMARENQNKKIDTVLFFDEANTTEALSMIKEVMVDRRVRGQPIGRGLERLQFIAACNPYRRWYTKNVIPS